MHRHNDNSGRMALMVLYYPSISSNNNDLYLFTVSIYSIYKIYSFLDFQAFKLMSAHRKVSGRKHTF